MNSVCRIYMRFVWRKRISKWEENGWVKCGRGTIESRALGKHRFSMARKRGVSMAGKRRFSMVGKHGFSMAGKCHICYGGKMRIFYGRKTWIFYGGKTRAMCGKKTWTLQAWVAYARKVSSLWQESKFPMAGKLWYNGHSPLSRYSIHRAQNSLCTYVFLQDVCRDRHYTPHSEMIYLCGFLRKEHKTLHNLSYWHKTQINGKWNFNSWSTTF